MIEFYYWEYALERFTTWLMGMCVGIFIGYYVSKKDLEEKK